MSKKSDNVSPRSERRSFAVTRTDRIMIRQDPDNKHPNRGDYVFIDTADVPALIDALLNARP